MDSSLNNKPVIVGGTGDRGVVSAASYESRTFGVHSGMSIKLARQLCPQAIYIRGNASTYTKFSKLVTEIIQSEVPVLEKSSVDEFYADLTGMDKFLAVINFLQNCAPALLKRPACPFPLDFQQIKRCQKWRPMRPSLTINSKLTKVLRRYFWLRFP